MKDTKNEFDNTQIDKTSDAYLELIGTPKKTFTGYTVATLPTGIRGRREYVTDALAPAFLVTLVGGGAVVSPAFYDGTNWIAA